MMFLVKCPDCSKTMKTEPRTDITKVVKKCVYCGRNFKIHGSLDRSRIVKRI